MKNEEAVYRVLWVDDMIAEADQAFKAGFEMTADERGIDLVATESWEEAEKELRARFDDYSAIILDANCRIGSADAGTRSTFIPHVVGRMQQLFGEQRRCLPWYILSAGTMDNMDFVVAAAHEEHDRHRAEWGEMFYRKESGGAASLLSNIRQAAARQALNIVAFRHAELFRCLGGIGGEARSAMLRTLAALHFPEECPGRTFDGNPLRKVLESMLRHALRQGLLPVECADEREGVNITSSCRFLSGLDTKVYPCGRATQVRWGHPGDGKDGRGGDTILDKTAAGMLHSVLLFVQEASHTTPGKPYSIPEADAEMFFAYALQLCHVIKSYCRFAALHPDAGENRKRHDYS